MLIRHASQHQSAIRRTHIISRKHIFHHLNPQLKKLIYESDFIEAQLFLFGEDFGVTAKLDAAEALAASQKKSVF